MTQLGLAEAARLTGKATSTIVRAAKQGKISASQNANGYAVYDVSELQRAFGPLPSAESKRSEAAAFESNATQQTVQRVYDQRIEGLEREIRRLEGTLDDVRSDRDQWRQQATALLKDHRPQATTPEPSSALVPVITAPAKRSGLWAKLTGRR